MYKTEIFHVRILTQGMKNLLQRSVVTPFRKLCVHRLLGTINLWQFSPLRTTSDNPKHPVEHHSVIFFEWPRFLVLLGSNNRSIYFHCLFVNSYRFRFLFLHTCTDCATLNFQTRPNSVWHFFLFERLHSIKHISQIKAKLYWTATLYENNGIALCILW